MTQSTVASQPTVTSDTLRVWPLGGQEEVGRNSTVFEYGNDIIILDMGLQFPGEDMPGIDYIIPNTESIEQKKKNIRGVIFSHGHLDHIGAAPMMLETLGNPLVIGRNLTLALVKRRVEDYRHGSAKNLKTLLVQSYDQTLHLGKFKVSFFRVEHSVMDAMGVIIETPHGTIIHPGDWAMETNPAEGDIVRYDHLSKLPSPRILMLESLGVTYKNPRVPTSVSQQNLRRLIVEAPGRIIIGTFSSQIARIKLLLEYAEEIGKKVALDGFSMKSNIEIAQKLGYIKVRKETLITIDRIDSYPDNKVIVICTGAQGEQNAVFSRIVNNQHRFVTIKPNDTIVFSSSVIPGNEQTVQRLKDRIYRLTENVIHSEIMDVHTGGHATAADIVEMLKQVQPDYFLPVYANYYMLVEAKKLALRTGMNPEQIFVLTNGQKIEFSRGQKPMILKERANTNSIMVDGLGIGDVSQIVLRDRQMLAEDGMVVVIATIVKKTGELIGNPDLISRGFVYLKENKKLIEDLRHFVKHLIQEGGNGRAPIDENFIKNKIREESAKFLFKKTERRPMILPVVIEV